MFIRPRIPKLDPIFLEKLNRGASRKEPKILRDDVEPVHFFGRQQREAVLQIKRHVQAELGDRIDSCSVWFSDSVLKYLP